jgi:hypothetical protein
MEDLHLVTSARYISDYTLELTFNDGLQANLDFSPWIEKYEIFKPLSDIEYFKNFSLDGWTVVWENGADVAPERLYEIAVESENLKAA